MNSGEVSTNKYANYMTIRALENGLEAIVGSANGEPIYYCIHSEGVWKKADMVTPAINAGDAISFKAEITPNSTVGCGNFDISRACSLEGNCMSLLYGDDVEGKPMKPYGFYNLFRYCSKIKNVSEDFLPATTLAEHCYHFMFSDCSSLTNAPKLPSMDLQPYCYYGMFYGCSSLKKAPILPVTTLMSQCYTQMFYGCKNLNYIKAMFTTTPSTSYTNSWVDGVAASGTFIKNVIASWNTTGIHAVPSGWTIGMASS